MSLRGIIATSVSTGSVAGQWVAGVLYLQTWRHTTLILNQGSATLTPVSNIINKTKSLLEQLPWCGMVTFPQCEKNSFLDSKKLSSMTFRVQTDQDALLLSMPPF